MARQIENIACVIFIGIIALCLYVLFKPAESGWERSTLISPTEWSRT